MSDGWSVKAVRVVRTTVLDVWWLVREGCESGTYDGPGCLMVGS